jgi:hypothetical protein
MTHASTRARVRRHSAGLEGERFVIDANAVERMSLEELLERLVNARLERHTADEQTLRRELQRRQARGDRLVRDAAAIQRPRVQS